MLGEILVFSDGKYMAIITRHFGNDGIHTDDTLVYLFEAIPLELTTRTENEYIDVSHLDGSIRRYHTGGSISRVEMSFRVIGSVQTGGDELLRRFKTADSMTITELFKEIQRKISEE